MKLQDGAEAERFVVPVGGLRSYKYNGRRYRFTHCKTFLLLYPDGELTGAQSSDVVKACLTSLVAESREGRAELGRPLQRLQADQASDRT